MNGDNPACRIGAALQRADIAPQVFEGNARPVFSRLKI